MKVNSEHFSIFPTLMQETRLDLDLDSLREFCYEIKRKNKDGVKLSNIGGWHSDDVISETHGEFLKLKSYIKESANRYHKEIEFSNDTIQMLENIWININQKGNANEWHVHQNAALSGAFYINVTSPIVFEHPYQHITPFYWNKNNVQNWNVYNSTIWSIMPEPNILLLFPAWLKHKVHVNEEDIDRITISFNTVFSESL